MSFFVLPAFFALFLTLGCWALGFLRHLILAHGKNKNSRLVSIEKDAQVELPPKRKKTSGQSQLELYKELFFKVQNLEDHPSVLEPARDVLLTIFSQGLSLALRQSDKGILSITEFSTEAVRRFIHEEHDAVLTRWEQYLERRKAGLGPELFRTVEEAKTWIKQHAPVKLVDGAWLGHMHRITTPFALRGVTKDAWQVLSEELGDGDLSKHHVYLYRQLLRDAGCGDLPEADSSDFTDPRHWDRDNPSVWKSAVGQLLISLFPNEFLPEILGFNMHYELITVETMQAAYELKEIGMNPYYFFLHISIDNADTGHTAMALHTVMRYVNLVRDTEGESAVRQVWKRIQTGYVLSEMLGRGAQVDDDNSSTSMTPYSLDPLSAKVIDIFKSKAAISQRVHCQSRVRIGRQTLAEWLSPAAWSAGPQRQLDLLNALSQAKPWVQAGNSAKSLLIRELSWEGRMFGAFTRTEVTTLETWINSLGTTFPGSAPYWKFTGRHPVPSRDAVHELRDVALHHPVIALAREGREARAMSIKEIHGHEDEGPPALLLAKEPLPPPSTQQLAALMPLWFAHIGLLENTIATPCRTASPLQAAVLRLLRAQAGFAAEADIIAGMDEPLRQSCPGLVDIGLELAAKARPTSALPTCLKDLLPAEEESDSVKFAYNMLRWATSPRRNIGLLLGLASAFLELKDAVVRAPGLLGDESRQVLRDIVARERESLEFCARELKAHNANQYCQFVEGYTSVNLLFSVVLGARGL